MFPKLKSPFMKLLIPTNNIKAKICGWITGYYSLR